LGYKAVFSNCLKSLRVSPGCADEPTCHSRQSDQKNRRNAVQSWPYRTVVPAFFLRQLNVTEDGQNRTENQNLSRPIVYRPYLNKDIYFFVKVQKSYIFNDYRKRGNTERKKGYKSVISHNRRQEDCMET